PNPLSPEEKKRTFSIIGLGVLIIIILGTFASISGILTIDRFTILVSILAVVIPIIYFVVMFRSPKTTKTERSNLIAYIPLFISAVIFFAIQEQGSIILATFADQRTNLNFAGFNLQSSWF